MTMTASDLLPGAAKTSATYLHEKQDAAVGSLRARRREANAILSSRSHT